LIHALNTLVSEDGNTIKIDNYPKPRPISADEKEMIANGSGAHAPDEYYVIESANPKIQSFDGAVMSFVEYLYELAK
jgi:hypothetical protein